MRLLILGGTGEARRIAQQLGQQLGQRDKIAVTYSLAGRTSKARLPEGCEVRIGGFGSDRGFANYAAGFDVVLDATHPFAANMHRRTALLDQPTLRLQRPAWTHHGRSFDSASVLATWLRDQKPLRLFLALGSFGWQPFEPLFMHQFELRGLDAPNQGAPNRGSLPSNMRFTVGQPGATVEDEAALFRALKIDALITRNAGGAQGRAKLLAAEKLELDLLVIERPALPDGLQIVGSENQALEWLSHF